MSRVPRALPPSATARRSAHMRSRRASRPTSGTGRSPHRPSPASTSCSGAFCSCRRQFFGIGGARVGVLAASSSGSSSSSCSSSKSDHVSPPRLSQLRSPATPAASPSVRSAHIASAACRKRFPGRFASMRSSQRSSPSGTGMAASRVGSEALMCMRITSRLVSAVKGGLPVASCHATQPTAYRSVHGPWSRRAPAACSGAMNSGVPAMAMPECSRSSSQTCASPKSVSFSPGRTSRFPRASTLAGLRSRWSTPSACA